MSFHTSDVSFSINKNLNNFTNDPIQLKIANKQTRIIACSSKELLKIVIPGMKSFNSLPTKLPANLVDKATMAISTNPLIIDKGRMIHTNVSKRLVGNVRSNRLSLFKVLL